MGPVGRERGSLLSTRGVAARGLLWGRTPPDTRAAASNRNQRRALACSGAEHSSLCWQENTGHRRRRRAIRVARCTGLPSRRRHALKAWHALRSVGLPRRPASPTVEGLNTRGPGARRGGSGRWSHTGGPGSRAGECLEPPAEARVLKRPEQHRASGLPGLRGTAGSQRPGCRAPHAPGRAFPSSNKLRRGAHRPLCRLALSCACSEAA